MWNELVDVLIYFLALYGVIMAIAGIMHLMHQKVGQDSTNVRMVLHIRNQEKTVEGIIRNVFSQNILGKIMSSKQLMIVDHGSTDQTVQILEKMKAEYEFMLLELGDSYFEGILKSEVEIPKVEMETAMDYNKND